MIVLATTVAHESINYNNFSQEDQVKYLNYRISRNVTDKDFMLVKAKIDINSNRINNLKPVTFEIPLNIKKCTHDADSGLIKLTFEPTQECPAFCVYKELVDGKPHATSLLDTTIKLDFIARNYSNNLRTVSTRPQELERTQAYGKEFHLGAQNGLYKAKITTVTRDELLNLNKMLGRDEKFLNNNFTNPNLLHHAMSSNHSVARNAANDTQWQTQELVKSHASINPTNVPVGKIQKIEVMANVTGFFKIATLNLTENEVKETLRKITPIDVKEQKVSDETVSISSAQNAAQKEEGDTLQNEGAQTHSHKKEDDVTDNKVHESFQDNTSAQIAESSDKNEIVAIIEHADKKEGETPVQEEAHVSEVKDEEKVEGAVSTTEKSDNNDACNDK